MMVRAILIVALGCRLLGCQSFHSASFASLDPFASIDRVDSPVKLSLDAAGEVTIVVTENPAPVVNDVTFFPGDELTLYVRDSDGRPIASHPFHSSYGRFCIDVIQMDPHPHPEFVFLTGEGRGPNARWEYLSVYTYNEREFHLRIRSPRSAPSSPGGRWWYEYQYRDSDGDGFVEIVMQLRHNTDESWKRYVPSDRERVLSVFTRQGLDHHPIGQTFNEAGE